MFAADCNVCRKDAELRAEWGCDRPTANLVKVAGCWKCANGEDAECPECHGEDEWLLDRCPNAAAAEAGIAAARVIQFAASLSHQVAVLPVSGGWFDQAATFCDLVPFAMRALTVYREQEQERNRREAENRARLQWQQNRTR